MCDLSDMGFFADGQVDFSVAVVRGQVKLGPKTKEYIPVYIYLQFLKIIEKINRFC